MLNVFPTLIQTETGYKSCTLSQVIDGGEKGSGRNNESE